ncbi:MerR family transcriptional regulator [Tumidithrix elongata RA019]|uniref:MerR family transcriptional regulator n=1 Tax=Tumidithrix elongata BACA0141 TaxID=2716417 RepID=A0AAW9PSE2_9CYAN|nr:MerR family transcriptional regulator [Tumidithrix elongata RA019]
MERTFTIQEAAEQTGVSTHTLRYYERINLLDPIARDCSGYRKFTNYDLDCVRFLTKLRATKMPIRQMQQFAELRRQGISSAHQRRSLLEEHYDAVTASQQELNHSLEVIRKKIAYYKELEEKKITSEAESYQLPTYIAMVRGGTSEGSIHLPLDPEIAAQKLIEHLDPASISKLIEQLQRSNNNPNARMGDTKHRSS